MQYGKSVVKEKQQKISKKQFNRQQDQQNEHVRVKHHDKAMWRSLRQAEREDNFPDEQF